MRIAHLSDPHFTHFTLDPSQFLSKRWMGNWNYQLFRRRAYQTDHLWHLPEFLAALNVDFLFITGDFSSTSLDDEFDESKLFVERFNKAGIPTHVLPGNHDCYTKEVEKKRRFYDFFPSEKLRQQRVVSLPLKQGWWYIGLDCALPTPLFCAYGLFTEEMEAQLEQTLSFIPENNRVILANHFPLFTAGRPFHDLKRADALQQLLKKFPQIALYLHGHDHRHYIIDRQQEKLPLTLNSGSCAHQPNGTFYLVDLFEKECLIQQLLYSQEKESCTWTIHWQQHYKLK